MIILDKISVEEVNFKILNYKLFVKLLELENNLLKKNWTLNEFFYYHF